MVINVNWTTTAATVTGSVGGLGYVYLNNKTSRDSCCNNSRNCSIRTRTRSC